MLIDDIRRKNLAFLARQRGGVGSLSVLIGKDPSQVSQWINGSINSGTGKPRGIRSSTCRTIEEKLQVEPGWLDKEHIDLWNDAKSGSLPSNVTQIKARRPEEIVIRQFETGGAMG